MKRLFALLAAIGMVAVAVVIRSNLDDDDSGGGSSSGPTTIACVTELEAQCRALANVTVRVEDAATTAEAIAAGDAELGGWVTLDPWPEIVDLLAKRDAVGDSTRIARSQLVIATVQERQDKFPCAPNWRCIGDAIGQPWDSFGGDAQWGDIKVGLPRLTSGAGLLMFGNAVSGFAGKADIATNDFELDPEFPVWRGKVTGSVANAPFTTFVQQFPAAFSFVGVIGAELSSSSRAGVGTIIPTPTASAVVVIAPVNGRKVSGLTSDLQRELLSSGWSTDGLDEPTGLPNAGVLLALSELTG